MTIDRAIEIQDAPTECPDNLPPCRFAWLNNFTSQFIGIDHDGTAFLEHLCHGTFSSGDTPGESNQDHGDGAYHVMDNVRNRN